MSAIASHITSLTIVYSKHRSKETSKFLVTGLCAGNSPVTGEFPAQRASNVENVSIWWRHHGWWQQANITYNTTEFWIEEYGAHSPVVPQVLSHTCPWVPGFAGVRKICISNAGTHGHTHQFSQSGQSRSRSWPVTQCPIARTWESAPKQCAVVAIVEDGSPTFETVLRESSGCICILSVG